VRRQLYHRTFQPSPGSYVRTCSITQRKTTIFTLLVSHCLMSHSPTRRASACLTYPHETQVDTRIDRFALPCRRERSEVRTMNRIRRPHQRRRRTVLHRRADAAGVQRACELLQVRHFGSRRPTPPVLVPPWWRTSSPPRGRNQPNLGCHRPALCNRRSPTWFVSRRREPSPGRAIENAPSGAAHELVLPSRSPKQNCAA
jgi:hypothetical protein